MSEQPLSHDRGARCTICGMTTHENDQHEAAKQAAGEFAGRAARFHIDHLPKDAAGCRAAGHCNHYYECCNCSGLMPSEERRLDILEMYREAGGQ
jgi:hypothetical protein